jgi:hypothetical protein
LGRWAGLRDGLCGYGSHNCKCNDGDSDRSTKVLPSPIRDGAGHC